MLCNISYKTDIKDIKEEIRKQYMQNAHNYIFSGEYGNNRRIRILKIIFYIVSYLFINSLLYKQGLPYIDNTSGNYLALAIAMSLLSPVFIGCVIYCQNIWFSYDIKDQCIKSIMLNLVNIEYIKKYNDSFNKPCVLTDNDIREFNLTETFNTKHVDDVFTGDYKNTNYSIQELKLYKGRGKHKSLEYEGAILKTNTNTNIGGWIEVKTKESIDKPYTFLDYFIMYFMAGVVTIVIFNSLIRLIPYYLYMFAGLGILDIVISYFIAKHCVNNDIIKANIAKKQLKYTNIEYINEKLSIKTSDNLSDVDSVINTEFIEIIDSLKKLFNTNKILCKFYSDKVMLAISRHENMFEIGGLFTPPTNIKVAEKFISQMTGLLIFLDFITSQNYE